MGDRLGEAKASGNLGNTLKVLGKFEEAVICCRKHLEICQEHSDKIGIGRALYNLGNVYHAKVGFVKLLFSALTIDLKKDFNYKSYLQFLNAIPKEDINFATELINRDISTFLFFK